MKLILGSSSLYRRSILERAGYIFESMSPNIDEKAIRSEDPRELVMMLANAKADALLDRVREPSVIIAGDQVCYVEGEIREKPESDEEVRRYLRSYREHPAELFNGLTVVNTETGKRATGVQITSVYFKDLSDETIEMLVTLEDAKRCAGGFKAEDPRVFPYIDRIEGGEDGTAGMPLDLLRELLKIVGYAV